MDWFSSCSRSRISFSVICEVMNLQKCTPHHLGIETEAFHQVEKPRTSTAILLLENGILVTATGHKRSL